MRRILTITLVIVLGLCFAATVYADSATKEEENYSSKTNSLCLMKWF